jgi:hypothetical protein
MNNDIYIAAKQVKLQLREAIYSCPVYNKILAPMGYVERVYVAGGAVASLIQTGTFKDIDIYFRDQRTAEIVNNQIKTKLHAEIADVSEAYKDANWIIEKGKMVTANAITMHTKTSYILCEAGEPDQLRRHFDYVHCMPWYDIANDTLHMSNKQYLACKSKLLIVNNIDAKRARREAKFLSRGYQISDGVIHKDFTVKVATHG